MDDRRGSRRRGTDQGRAGPGRPRDASRDEAILAATLAILLERGYQALTIEGVATSVGVGRPTIYRRWPSKPALAVAALVHSSRLAIPVRDRGSLRDELVAVQRHQIKLMNSPESRRVTAGLIVDLANDPELAEMYVSHYLVPPGGDLAGAPARDRSGRAPTRDRLRVRVRPPDRAALHAGGGVGPEAGARGRRADRRRRAHRVPRHRPERLIAARSYTPRMARIEIPDGPGAEGRRVWCCAAPGDGRHRRAHDRRGVPAERDPGPRSEVARHAGRGAQRHRLSCSTAAGAVGDRCRRHRGRLRSRRRVAKLAGVHRTPAPGHRVRRALHDRPPGHRRRALRGLHADFSDAEILDLSLSAWASGSASGDPSRSCRWSNAPA